MKTIKDIFKEQFGLIDPSKEEIKAISDETKEITQEVLVKIKKAKIRAEIFIGGSFAKNTIIKKEKYDVDIFIRFDPKYNDEEISKLLAKIVPAGSKCLHGSRDYFKKEDNDLHVEFEIIPTIKIKKPLEARNITDLSYFHVSYVAKKLKANKKLTNEIKLAKSFIHGAECYGAESYINGFSGYAVELLIIHYGSLLNFIKKIAASNEDKIIIDQEKYYKNKDEVMKKINESKLKSPIVLIDPTFKERNAMSALSGETFARFREFCVKFLKNPSNNFFKIKDKKGEFEKKHKDLIKIEIKTDKQAGDIAGTKLKKFYGFFVKHATRFFDISASEFLYDEKLNLGNILLVAKQKKEIVFSGPPVSMEENLKKFKLEHKNIKIIKGQAFAYEKSIGFDDWFNEFKCKDEKLLGGMDISELRIV